MDNKSTKFSGLAQTKLRAQAGQGGNHHSGRDPGHREESENTAGERSGCKTKHCWGLGVAIKKWSRTPTLSKLTHIIISCDDPRLVGSTNHRKWFRHDYFLRQSKAGRLHPSSKSGQEPPLSRTKPAAPWGGVPKVAPETSPYMVLRAVWLVALRLDGVVFQKVAPELLIYIGDAGRWGGIP